MNVDFFAGNERSSVLAAGCVTAVVLGMHHVSLCPTALLRRRQGQPTEERRQGPRLECITHTPVRLAFVRGPSCARHAHGWGFVLDKFADMCRLLCGTCHSCATLTFVCALVQVPTCIIPGSMSVAHATGSQGGRHRATSLAFVATTGV